jgi:hypothetical protein
MNRKENALDHLRPYAARCIGVFTVCALVAMLPLTPRSMAADSSTNSEPALSSVEPGSVVNLGQLTGRGNPWTPVSVDVSNAPGPQFLFSDKPEYFRAGNGISLQEDVRPGMVRLYIYHVPEPGSAEKTISSTIENLGHAVMSFRFLHYGSPSPGLDYPRIAKEGLAAFFDSNAGPEMPSLKPGEKMVIDPRLDRQRASKNQLVHGFYEFEINQPARVTVFRRDPTDSSIQVVEKLKRLSLVTTNKSLNGGAGRGLFDCCERTVTNHASSVIDTAEGPVRLIIADGKRDPWIVGRDDIDGRTDARNVGNYGVVYRISLKWKSSDGRGLALLMCPFSSRASGCGGVATAVRVSRGVFPAGTVLLPAHQNTFGGNGEAALIQRFEPASSRETQTLELVYSPPGAACIPTPFLFLPYRIPPR